jgi:histone H3/H4
MSDSEELSQAQLASDDESEEAAPAVAAVVDDDQDDAADADADADLDASYIVDDDADNDHDVEVEVEVDMDAEMDAEEAESISATPAKSNMYGEDEDNNVDADEDDDNVETPSRAPSSISNTPATSTASPSASTTASATKATPNSITTGSASNNNSADATITPVRVYKKPGPKPGSKRKRRDSPKKLKPEIPSTKDLFVPFRAIKRIMKLDKDIGTVQNEAAMVATYAVEMFMEKMVNESHDKAKRRGRNTVKYEDLAEVRAEHKNMGFLNTLIP